MINVNDFYNELVLNNIHFFTGVPDSLLKDICAYITQNTSKNNHIIAANEGGAIALACGYNLATNKVPLVYMQNSGIGNAINPLLSLADKEVYSIPILLMIGWRGEPGIHDEPQHIKQGRITLDLLKSLEIPYFVLDGNSDFKKSIHEASSFSKTKSSPVALVISKNTFLPYEFIQNKTDQLKLTREKALEILLRYLPQDSIIVATTGMLSRELFELRIKYKQSHNSDFLTVGSMGHASQIALGIAISKPTRKVICLDGDGSVIMHTGSLGIIGDKHPENFYHFIFNNESHDSVGGQPTIANQIDFLKLSEALNYNGYIKLLDENDFALSLNNIFNSAGPCLIEIKVNKGSRKDLGRPTNTPIENKFIFSEFLNLD